MAFIIPQTANDSARIGYKNLFTTSGVTVTASSEASGLEKENAIDWKSYDWWQPTSSGWLRASFVSAKTADYMAIAAHDLGSSSVTIVCQYSTDGGSVWTDIGGTQAPVDDNVIFVTFDSTQAADWRISISGVANLGVVVIGETTELPVGMAVGFNAPTLAEDHKYYTSVSEGGVHLGASLREINNSFSINLKNIDPAWFRSTWADILDHIRVKPFFFSWDSANHSDEAVFSWVNKKIGKPTYSSPVRMSVSIPVECNK